MGKGKCGMETTGFGGNYVDESRPKIAFGR